MNLSTSKNNFINLIMVALCFCFVISCSTNKFNGAYVGTLSDGTNEEQDIPVTLTQTGTDVSISIKNSRMLGTCNLYGKLHKNGGVYMDNPQPCGSPSIQITGTMSFVDDGLMINLTGLDRTTGYHFQYRSKKN